MAIYRSGFHRDVSSVLNQIGGKTACLTYGDGKQVRGVGPGGLEGAWLYSFGMQTGAAFRRPWAGKAIVACLFARVLAENARGVYFQREKDNPDNRQFYPSLEFQTVYAFHYRTLFRDD